MMVGSRLVIGLDFGTTFSGVAYCDEDGAKQGIAGIQLVVSWPGLPNESNEKVPTKITYGTSPGRDKEKILWGNQIKPNTKSLIHSLMKLELNEKSKLYQEPKGSKIGSSQALQKWKKNVTDIITDYLRSIQEHVWVELERQYGKVLLKSMTKEVVVTVPAVWSEVAKEKTMKAVQLAKFDVQEYKMVTEPEAAAIYTLKGIMEGMKKTEVKVGDVFVLCDAGGGTVDLISYKITRVDPKFKVEEAAVGSGDQCGATYVDKEFLSWLEGWIGTQRFKRIPEEKKKLGGVLLTNFEKHKFYFSGNEDDMDICLPRECGVQDDEDLNIDDRVLSFKKDQMVKVFEPCVERTIELIQGQVEAVKKRGFGIPKMAFLVGGFGRNGYLYKRVQEYFAARGIETRQPQFPWSAVARGAVCCGLENNQAAVVTMRLARKHYGALFSRPFDASKHEDQDRYTHIYTGMELARNQIEWLCSKGESLSTNNPKTMKIGVSFDCYEDDDRTREAVLVGCSEDEAWKRFDGIKVKTICRVRANFTDVPLSKFREKSSPGGRRFWQVDFTLAATFGSAEIQWKAIYQNEEIGRTTVTYDD